MTRYRTEREFDERHEEHGLALKPAVSRQPVDVSMRITYQRGAGAGEGAGYYIVVDVLAVYSPPEKEYPDVLPWSVFGDVVGVYGGPALGHAMLGKPFTFTEDEKLLAIGRAMQILEAEGRG